MRLNDNILTLKLESMMVLQMLDSFPGFLLKAGTLNCHFLIHVIIYNSYVHVADNSKFLQPKDLSASHLQLDV